MKIRLRDYDTKEIMRFLREATGLNRDEFGKSISKAGSTIKNYEIGKSDYTLSLIKEISKKYDIEVIFEKKEK